MNQTKTRPPMSPAPIIPNTFPVYEVEVLIDDPSGGPPEKIRSAFFTDFETAITFAEQDKQSAAGRAALSRFYRFPLRLISGETPEAYRARQDAQKALGQPKEFPAPIPPAPRPRAHAGKSQARAGIAKKSQHAPTPTRARSTRAPRARAAK